MYVGFCMYIIHTPPFYFIYLNCHNHKNLKIKPVTDHLSRNRNRFSNIKNMLPATDNFFLYKIKLPAETNHLPQVLFSNLFCQCINASKFHLFGFFVIIKIELLRVAVRESKRQILNICIDMSFNNK